MKTAIVFDTETTNLTLPSLAPIDKQPKIIEIAAALVDADGLLLDTYETLINPGELITAEITKITGITNERLAAAPSLRDVAQEVGSFFSKTKTFVAHNAPFDVAMMNNEWARMFPQAGFFRQDDEIICTVQEFYHMFGHRPKLTELYEYFTGEKLEQTHRALDDVMALVRALKYSGFFDTILT